MKLKYTILFIKQRSIISLVILFKDNLTWITYFCNIYFFQISPLVWSDFWHEIWTQVGLNQHCFGAQHYLHRLHSTWFHNNSNRDHNLSHFTFILGRVNIYKHPVKLCITNLLNIRRAALSNQSDDDITPFLKRLGICLRQSYLEFKIHDKSPPIVSTELMKEKKRNTSSQPKCDEHFHEVGQALKGGIIKHTQNETIHLTPCTFSICASVYLSERWVHIFTWQNR